MTYENVERTVMELVRALSQRSVWWVVRYHDVYLRASIEIGKPAINTKDRREAAKFVSLVDAKVQAKLWNNNAKVVKITRKVRG